MKTTFVAFILALTLTLPVVAEEADDPTADVIAKVISAYGGDSLTNLTSYELKRVNLAPSTGQSRRPQLEDIATSKIYLLHDLAGDRVLFESTFESRDGVFQGLQLRNNGVTHTLNVRDDTFGPAQNPDPYVFAGGTMRTSDTLLAYHLANHADTATHTGVADYMNRQHDLITMPFPSSPDLTLYIDNSTGLISKMTRENPQVGTLEYVFSNVQAHNGVSFASRTAFFLAGRPNLVSITNTAQFNFETDDVTFAMPEGYTKERQRIDTSEMLANKLADGVFHIGQGAGFSLFVDTSEGLVGVGGYPQLKDRLVRFQTETGNYKRLAYQVVTHHHSDHLGGLGDAVELGATLVIVEDDRETVLAALPNDADVKLLNAGTRISFGDGKRQVDIYDIATSHVAHYLLVHLPELELVFMADHLNSPYESGTPNGTNSTRTIYEAIKALDLDVKQIVIAHGARVFTMKELSAAATGFIQTSCLDDRPVCDL